MNNIEIGQTWESKTSHPYLGHCFVRIIKIYDDGRLSIRFTTSEWEDHWVPQIMNPETLLEEYKLQ